MVAEVPLYRDRPEAAGRSDEGRPMAGAGAARRQARAAPRFSEVARARSTRTCTRRCATSRSRCSRRRARRPTGCRSFGNGRGGTRRSARRCGSTRGSRTSMRRAEYREAVLTTPACGAGTCHFGSQTAAERNIDGILFFNESADPTHWTDQRVRADAARMVRVCAARRRSRSGVSRDHRARRAEARRAPAVAGVHHADLRDDDACDAARHRPRASMRRCSSSTARPKPACCSWNASTAGCIRTSGTATSISCRCRASARLARVLVTTLGRAWMPLLRYDIGDVVRLAESRDCACGSQSDGPLLERVEGRQSDCTEVDGETITPLHARRRDPRGARRGGDARAVATRRRQPARRRSRIDGARRSARCHGRGRAAAHARFAASASAPSRRRHPASTGSSSADAEPRAFRCSSAATTARPFIYLDSASTTPKPREVIAAVTRYYETLGANVHRGLLSARGSGDGGIRARAASRRGADRRAAVRDRVHAQRDRLVQSRRACAGAHGRTTRSCFPRRSITRTIMPWRVAARPVLVDIDDEAVPKWSQLDGAAREAHAARQRRARVERHGRDCADRGVDRDGARGRRPRARRRFAVGRASADRRACARRRLPGVLEPQDVRPERRRRALRAPRPVRRRSGSATSAAAWSRCSPTIASSRSRRRFATKPARRTSKASSVSAPPSTTCCGIGMAHDRRALARARGAAHRRARRACRTRPCSAARSRDRIALATVSLPWPAMRQQDIARLLADAHAIFVSGGFHCAHVLHHRLRLDGTLRASAHIYNDAGDIEAFVRALRDL